MYVEFSLVYEINKIIQFLDISQISYSVVLITSKYKDI